MQVRQIFTVLSLVLLPTAILSFMAHRTLENREQILRDRYRTAAAGAIESISKRLESRLYSSIDQVRATFHEYLQRTARFQDIESTAIRLRRTIPLVEEVFIFMDPWGLVYPGGMFEPGAAPQQKTGNQYIMMQNLLRKKISEAKEVDLFLFKVNNNVYCSTLLPGRKDLYAGYQIDPAAFTNELQNMILAESGRGFRLSVMARTDVARSGTGVDKSGDLLETSLFEPFDNIRITGVLESNALMSGEETWQARLYAWSIILLAGSVLLGTVIALIQGVEEVRKAKARSEFLVGVSHDLRTPVASMKMLSESLLSGRVKDKNKKDQFLATMAAESEKLNQLIERVIYFVRLGQNALAYNLDPVNPADIVEKSIQSFRNRFHVNSPEVQVGMPDSLPDIYADAGAMEQVILNLLDNAAKYGKQAGGLDTGGGVNAGISLSVEVENRKKGFLSAEHRWVRISVTDYGPGIPAREHKKIFRRYYRSPGAEKANVSGVGLGLALCRHIVRAHNGGMEVESKKGKGATFSILIPEAGWLRRD